MKNLIFLLLAVSLNANNIILVIESYHKEYAWDKSYIEGIKEVLGDMYEIKRYELDTKRLPQNKWEAKANEAWRLYEEIKPKAVIIGDDIALQMLGKKFETTNTPVVFLGINNNPRKYITLGKNITGILERPLIKRSIASIKEIIPNAKKILIVFDDDTTSRVIYEEEFESKETIEIQNMNITVKLINKENIWKDTINNSKSKFDAIIIGLYQAIKDNEGKNISADEILSWTSKNTTIPLFGFWDFSVGDGKTSGGLVLYGKTQGVAAAQIVKDVLAGEDISKIKPRIGEKGKYFFNKKELNRFGLEVPLYIEKGAEYN